MIHDPVLHQSILDNPSDLDARLIYGDWLAEHGDPRGEFIQCEVAMEGVPEWSFEHSDLHFRAKYLSLQHRAKWDEGILDVIKSMKKPKGKRGFLGDMVDGRNHVMDYRESEDVSFRYRVGFADYFEFRNLPQTRDLDRLVKVAPIRRIKMLWFNDAESRRLNTAVLKGVDQFDLFVRDNAKCLKRLLHGDPPLDLNVLRLYITQRTHAGQENPRNNGEMTSLAMMLANSNSLSRLKEFQVNAAGFGGGSIQRLVDSPAFSNLERLTLTEGSFGDSGMAIIANSHLGKQLRYLKVKLTGIGDKGFKALADAGPENLHTLSMGWWFGSNPTVAGFGALTNCQALSRLHHLDLRGWRCDPDCIAELANSTSLTNLRMLNLANSDFDDEKAELLAGSENLRLHYLNLDANPKLTGNGLRALLNSPVLEDLTYLNLRDCPGWGNEAASLLAKSKYTKQIRYLSLERTGLSRAGVNSIAKASNLLELRQIDVGGNGFSQVKKLADSEELENLMFINLAENGLSEKQISIVNKRLANGVLLVHETVG